MLKLVTRTLLVHTSLNRFCSQLPLGCKNGVYDRSTYVPCNKNQAYECATLSYINIMTMLLCIRTWRRTARTVKLHDNRWQSPIGSNREHCVRCECKQLPCSLCISMITNQSKSNRCLTVIKSNVKEECVLCHNHCSAHKCAWLCQRLKANS